MTVQSLARPSGLPAIPQIAVRYLGLAAVAVIVAALHFKHRPATVCVLRAVTGLPCPACGGTTAAVDLGHGHLIDALRASPLAVGLFLLGPILDKVPRPAWWASKPTRWGFVIGLLAVSELWELIRFGIISV